MSIPPLDPTFTVDELRAVGQAFLDAGLNYWEAAHRAGIGGAVIWLTGSNGELVMFTRGEYRDTLLRNVDSLGGPTISFGAGGEVDP